MARDPPSYEWRTNETNGISAPRIQREFLTRGLRGSDDDDEELCFPFCPIARFSRDVGQISVMSESIGIIDGYLSPRME